MAHVNVEALTTGRMISSDRVDHKAIWRHAYSRVFTHTEHYRFYSEHQSCSAPPKAGPAFEN